MADDDDAIGIGHDDNNDPARTSPLLFLLDGVLSQDEERVQAACDRIRQLPYVTLLLPLAEGDPCTSPTALMHILNVLLQAHPQLASTASDHDGSLPLHFCASLGNVAVASLVFNKYPQAAATPNQKGKIPLHYAAREGRVDMVHYLLQAAPETVAIATDKGKLAVHFSAGEGHAAITTALLRQYPKSASAASAKGKLPLHFCSRWGYLDIAHELLRYYPDAVRALDWEGSLPLHDAAREGQYRMSRYLIERFPVALQTANLRGEIPLFPAARSNSVDLVLLMIQAWPVGGKYVLRNVSPDDNIDSWNWDILELLLRGAVNNLAGCALLEGREPPTVSLTEDVEPAAMLSPEEIKANKKKNKKAKLSMIMAAGGAGQQQQPRLAETHHRWTFHSLQDTSAAAAWAPPGGSFPGSAPTAPAVVAAAPHRSKSPILGNGGGGGGVAMFGGSGRRKHKRSRNESISDPSLSDDQARTFIPLHAAFEIKSSPHTIEHVISQRPQDIDKKDERGRFALHWAVLHCHSQDAIVDLVVNKDNNILTPEAAGVADSTGKLPLHLAIASHAHVSVIKALLEAHPEGGVEPCRTQDAFHGKSPIYMATHHDCDLSTVFELLRVDPSFVSPET